MATNLMVYGSDALTVSQRDIVLVSFPFSDLSASKVRPALVISSDAYNAANPDAVVLAITTNLSASPFKVKIGSADLQSGSLPAQSAVRVDKPFSTLQQKFLKVQARFARERFREVLQKMDLVFDRSSL